MADAYKIALSVRHLVEYVFLSGSIDAGLQSVDALLEGTKAHQKVQQTYGEEDQKEVYLRADIACDDLLFVVDGRCDGLLATGLVQTIDEIKSTRADLSLIEGDGYAVHWAQALMYAYMYARQEALPAMRMQLTYVRKNTGETRRFVREATYEEMEAQVMDIVRRYAPFARMRHQHEMERNASITGLAFPYDAYRAGQRKLAGAVYRTIEQGVSLLAKAPTGTGKTISTTFPAIKAIGSGLLHRFYYVTARTTTRAAAEDALQLMQNNGLRLHAVTVTAKEKICFQDEMICRKEHCPYADGYYDRINEAMLDMLGNETIMSRSVIETYARKHTVCPFEMSLDAAYAADAVICDYNYVFDPRVAFKRLYGEVKRKTTVLVDEAHNLPDRAREIYSAELSKAPFLALQRELKQSHKPASEAAKAINKYFIELRKRAEESKASGDGAQRISAHPGCMVEREAPKRLIELADAFVQAAEGLIGEGGGIGADSLENLRDAFFAALQFTRCASYYDERFVSYTEASSRDVRQKLLCLNPSELLRQTAKGYRSFVYFSATLSPLSYYMEVLGAGDNDYTLSLPSPFSSEQLDVRIAPVSTRYQHREESIGPIADLIRQTAAEREGNYIAFFPSYAYMNAVAQRLEDELSEGMELLIQRTAMSEPERDAFLAAFHPEKGLTRIGFAVMGGVFSEGVDLPGDRLIGVIVVGVGLPQLGLERDLLRDYYNGQEKSGFDYAYVVPGMNKVLQAGGRLIRSETDRGTLTLIDNRYMQNGYRRLLPDEWAGAARMF